MTKTDAQNDLGSTAVAVSAGTGSNPFGNFELGSVEVVGEEGDDFEAAAHSGFVTIGDAVQIEIEGPNAPAIAAFIVRACSAHADLVAALRAIVAGLDVPRNRFGKLDGDLATSNPLANLAVKFNLPHGGGDIAEAAVMVARAALALAEPSST